MTHKGADPRDSKPAMYWLSITRERKTKDTVITR